MRRLAWVVGVVLSSGCGTLLSRQHAPGPYGGVRFDAGFYFPLLAPDLPLSFVLDTLLLPFDLTAANDRRLERDRREALEALPPGAAPPPARRQGRRRSDAELRDARPFDAPRDVRRERPPLPRIDHIPRAR